MKGLMRVMVLGLGAVIAALPVYAENSEYQCEVMTVEGKAYVTQDGKKTPLKEGDLVKVDGVIETEADAQVDLAFDGNWKNTALVEESSKITVQSIFPTEIKMEKGALFAKLKALPEESRFEVETPTAIAAVRGTEYRTAIENGETQVYNFSESDVYVFGRDASGAVLETPAILKNREKAGIAKKDGRVPQAAKMSEAEFRHGEQIQKRMDKKIGQIEAQGRKGRIQAIEKIKQDYKQGVRRDNMKPYHLNTAPPGKQKELEQRLKMKEARSEKGFPGAQNGEPKNPQFREQRREAIQEARQHIQDNRQERRQEQRQENRQEFRQENRQEFRQDNRQMGASNPRQDKPGSHAPGQQDQHRQQPGQKPQPNQQGQQGQGGQGEKKQSAKPQGPARDRR